MKSPMVTLLCSASVAATSMMSPAVSAQDGPPLIEVHVWGGNEADDSSAFGLRSAEVASWFTRRDRVGLRYDNSLSQDNPALARSGIDAEAWFLSYLHDFSGQFLASAEIGTRDLPNGDQEIYRVEGVHLHDNRAAKVGIQISPTEVIGGDYTDTLVYGSYNFPIGDNWRIEPAVYLSETGLTDDTEWRIAGYVEYNAPNGWQVGVGAGFGQIDSSIPAADGEVFNAHARLSIPVAEHHQIHLQVRHEDAPLTEYTTALVGVSLRFPR